VLEEAPAPLISDVRRALSEAGRSAARAVNYVGAGTVEFLLDGDGGFHFMEMNTRLQVEHPVTEMITGLDLVEWQLRIAAGEPLPLTQDEVTMRGHAIEARIYAEDPAHDFRPSIGKIVYLRAPAASQNVRIDTGIEEGDTITPFYDPMIAKLIVWDESRELAVRRMTHALGAYQMVGVANNVEFLRRLATSQSFSEVNLDTGLIEREHAWLHAEERETSPTAVLLAALNLVLGERDFAADQQSPWAVRDGWRMNGRYVRSLQFTQKGRELHATVEYRSAGFAIRLGDHDFAVSSAQISDGTVRALVNGHRVQGRVVAQGKHRHVFFEGRHSVFEWNDPLDVEAQHHAGEGSLMAPMPGRVVALVAAPGDRVEKGAPLMVLEAMKMECTIHAPSAGCVRSFHFAAGDQVSEGVELLHFEREETGENGNG
jgi:3-methylcrotonyl-CoA carboxylase alpha subunit